MKRISAMHFTLQEKSINCPLIWFLIMIVQSPKDMMGRLMHRYGRESILSYVWTSKESHT